MDQNLPEEVGEEFWKNFFWVSGLFQGPYCFLGFLVFAIPISLLFGDKNRKIDPKLHVELFQGSIWPEKMKNLFKISHDEDPDEKIPLQ